MFKIISIFTLTIIIITGCISDTAHCKEAKTLCIAHRGGAAYAPENTMAAFKNAIKMNADYFEVDVHLTKDGHVVVIHDDTLERTTDGKGMVKDKTLAQLKKLDAGSWFSKKFKGEKIPTLEETLDLAKGKIGVVIEIKNGPVFHKGIEKKVINMIRKKTMQNEVIIISFDHECIRRTKKIAPEIKAGILFYGNVIDSAGMAESIKAEYVCPGWQLVTDEMILNCRKNNRKMNLWTINDKQTMKFFIDKKVDAITTDKPDILIKLLKESS